MGPRIHFVVQCADASGLPHSSQKVVAKPSGLSSSFRGLVGIIAILCSFLTIASAEHHGPAVQFNFNDPPSDTVDHVNPLIGNGGTSAIDTGGMIPSTAPPFAMTRWVAQTRENRVSVLPYNYTDTSVHGFQGTHQPAVWMGESGQVLVSPGAGQIRPKFEDRGMTFNHAEEVISASYYNVELSAIEGGKIFAEQSATSRVGHLRFTFTDTKTPYVLLEATRASAISWWNPKNVTYPEGSVMIDPDRLEICGSNPERQDHIISPISTPATKWSAYFCARFDQPFAAWGITQNGTVTPSETSGTGAVLSGYAVFDPKATQVNVRIAVSFISIDQARENLDQEIPDGQSLEVTARNTRSAWAEKLDRIQLFGATDEQKQVFYTAFFHTLQYPYEQGEYGRYYSGYDDSVHEGVSYTGYSNWDIYRAEWAWLILFAPERLPGMVQSMIQDYEEGGWLPMWKNIIETNMMIGTHADSLIAEAVLKGVTGFDLDAAWSAVYKDATVPPVDDTTTLYYNGEQGVDYEVRAGLSTVYEQKGWVANDIHPEAASRTLDYSYDDYAISVLAGLLNKTDEQTFFRERSMRNPFLIFNSETGFMEARNASGAWAGEDNGWTEGDKWIYTFEVIQDIPILVEYKGGNRSFVEFLDEHFDGGHNDPTNEPSNHIPYLYSLVGAASRAQVRVRQIADTYYNTTLIGLPGNDDCGQMSAWYLFTVLGFYPVDPVSGNYVVGSPFFDAVVIDLPGAPNRNLTIISPGAPTKPYVHSLSVGGIPVDQPILRHDQIARGGVLAFDMRDTPQFWGSEVVPDAPANESIFRYLDLRTLWNR